MTAPTETAHERNRLRRWPWVVALVTLCLVAAGGVLQAARHHARLWNELRAFASAFGGMIGVALLLAVGLALLFLFDAFLFREDGRNSDEPPD